MNEDTSQTLTLEQQFALQTHRRLLTDVVEEAIANAGIEGRPVNANDFSELINECLSCLENAMHRENFIRQQLHLK